MAVEKEIESELRVHVALEACSYAALHNHRNRSRESVARKEPTRRLTVARANGVLDAGPARPLVHLASQADLGDALKTPPTRPKRGLLGWLDGAEELYVYLPQRRKARRRRAASFRSSCASGRWRRAGRRSSSNGPVPTSQLDDADRKMDINLAPPRLKLWLLPQRPRRGSSQEDDWRCWGRLYCRPAWR